ncbi:MAG TPA: hypothetical protein VNI01_14305, partial [Elusimicrobiota bacterium]|nr:hypothetical protein [Elusimicrobiota bacterium]
MSLPRCSTARPPFVGKRTGAGLLLAAAVLAAAGRPASAQQVYIRNLWVNSADRDAGSTCSGPDSRGQIICKRTSANPSPPQSPCEGNISNDPEIQYDNPVRANCAVNFGNSCGIVPNPYGATIANNIPAGSRIGNIANNRVALCSKLGWANTQSGNSTFGIDFVSFEVFKFAQGTNPLDSGSAPPLRTYFIDDPGIILAGTTSDDANGGGSTAVDPACIYWDGDINIQGEFGKSNGDYGFRATVSTNQTGASGNINISQTRAYPGSATLDYSASSITDGATTCTNSGVKGPGTTGCAGNSTSCATAPGNVVDQKPIKVDVTNIHVVRTSPTVVGDLTAVAAEPYNITYRLSKDANMTITINNASASGSGSQVRALVPNQERAGEGIPSGTLQNGDSWNGRADNGDLLLPGLYLADMIAFSNDQYGTDVSNEVFRQIALDPLQITDVRVQPLAEQSTSLAVISFVLTEPATAYLEIYPPGTQFGPVCGGAKVNPLSNLWDDCQDIDPFIAPPTGNPINSTLLGRTLLGGGNDSPQARLKDFNPTLGGLTAPLIRRIFEQKDARKSVILFWDGRDKNGNVVEDGDYVFVLYADLPSMNGCPYPSNAGSTPGVVCTGANATSFSNSQRIFATNAKSGFIPVNRGLVTVSQIGPSSTVIGSSPPVAGLDPFTFSYTLSRDATVSLKIFNTINGAPQQEVRTLVNKEQRPGAFLNRERWNFPTDNNGLVVSSGNYLVQLTAYDPFIPAKVSTTTALFPINLFRVTDVFNSPLLTGATDVVSLSYQLSQPMFVAWNIYPPGTVVHDPAGTGNPYWPPCQALIPNSTTCTQISSTTFQNQAQVGVAPIITINGMRPGRLRVSEFWDGRDANGIFVADGNYIYTLVAQSTTTPQYFATDQVVGQLTVARGSIVFPVFNVTPTLPVLFNSSQTVALAPYEISYSVTRQSSVTIQILNTNLPPSIVRTIIQGQVREANIINREFWDARNDSGTFVTAGFYNVRA